MNTANKAIQNRANLTFIAIATAVPPVPNSLIIDQCLVCNHRKQFEKIMLQLAKITFFIWDSTSIHQFEVFQTSALFQSL